jgi:hypothetical protein
MILGQANEASSSTGIQNPNIANPVSAVFMAGGELGVQGVTSASNGHGVIGSVSGFDGRAVTGNTSGHFSQIAVDGNTTPGVGEGIAVRGRTLNGIGVYAEATGGFALQVVGRAVFNRSGKTTLAAGTKSKTISGHTMAATTIVVATVQGNPSGVWVRNVSVSDAVDTFTIRLNKAAPAGGVVVGFFIVN